MSKVNHHASYLHTAFQPEELLKRYRRFSLDEMGIDLLVGCGLSGTLGAVTLGVLTNTRYAIVRKPRERTHSGKIVEGIFCRNDRWLFVDDLVSSGDTQRYVLEAMAPIHSNFKMIYVGDLLFNRPEFTPYNPKVNYTHEIFDRLAKCQIG